MTQRRPSQLQSRLESQQKTRRNKQKSEPTRRYDKYLRSYGYFRLLGLFFLLQKMAGSDGGWRQLTAVDGGWRRLTAVGWKSNEFNWIFKFHGWPSVVCCFPEATLPAYPNLFSSFHPCWLLTDSFFCVWNLSFSFLSLFRRDARNKRRVAALLFLTSSSGSAGVADVARPLQSLLRRPTANNASSYRYVAQFNSVGFHQLS